MKLVRATILMAVHDEQWFEPPDHSRASAIFGMLENDAEGAEIVHLTDIEIVSVAIPDPEVDWADAYFAFPPEPAEPAPLEPDPYDEWQVKAEQEFVRLGWRKPEDEECTECGQGGTEPGYEHKSSCSLWRDHADGYGHGV